MLSASLPRGRRAAGGCDILPELFLAGHKGVNEEDTTRTPEGRGRPRLMVVTAVLAGCENRWFAGICVRQ
jgi:hypothetical protein